MSFLASTYQALGLLLVLQGPQKAPGNKEEEEEI